MERTVRLTTGLTLFAFAACHFTSHATGLFRLPAMDAVGRNILLSPWQGWAGRSALFVSLFVHASLGLRALYRRRHLRIPAAEAWQLGLGLSIPFLIIPHAVNVRLGAVLYGLDDSYYRILYQYWMTSPATGLLRQFTLLCFVWVHGCIGIHFWLRFRPFYGKCRPILLAVAVLLPFLAVLGLVNAGWDTAMTAALQPGFAETHGPPPAGTPKAFALAALRSLWEGLQLAYVALVGCILALRFSRNIRERRAALRITYPSGRVVEVPRGFSVLEASRWARIPHAAICGGRGRCSTCRVRVARGLDGLAPSMPGERETLERVKAPPSVRLACQLRPGHDVSVVPLLPASVVPQGIRSTVNESREVHITALFIDLRGSTDLAAGRLPFDALFIIDRYVQRVTAAVQRHGGHVTSVAADGIMSVFGIAAESAAAGAVAALQAALAIWESLEQLSTELQIEITQPLAFGIGMHSGIAAVGSILVLGRPSVMFLGDTGNVAARLEAMTKELQCTVIVSDAVLGVAGHAVPAAALHELQIRGREGQPCRALMLRSRDEALSLIPFAELTAAAGRPRRLSRVR